ncbi:DUF805 domain-containing protein [Croceicoccus pelagius]|nr:DUF805 domain-containing protein [Croceicoccus pelagius]
MLMPYRRYFEFSGRSRRKEYWMFALFNFLVYLAFMVLMFALGGSMQYNGEAAMGPLVSVVMIAMFIWAIATIIPSLAVTFRRLHDTDHSAWWILIGLVPIIGGLVLLYFYLIEGTHGANRFGPDPKEGEARGV